ncbi:MAG: MTH1187 family thiamine-binding protein [Deltaproteobacteria bacterium]|nr:MTH1187 family thiamine-binding protein [Deltaproteobacteria bacterium]
MSTLIDLSIFPVGKGESVSPYVARVVTIIKDSGLQYKLGPMGTTIEGEWDELMDVVTRCFKELKKDCARIYMSAKVDYREQGSNRIVSKVKSVGGSI